jgi:hypothetical protein
VADVCISTVADRHALHSVYYSAVKKTVFDLTKRIFAMRKATRNAREDVHRRPFIEREQRAPHRRSQFNEYAKTSMK